MKKRKILLAEDDKFTQYMMGEIFKTLGYEYDIAGNGKECEDLVNANPSEYGVILMDIHMPEVSGVEAAKAIRAHPDDPPRGIPIIAVTADGDYLTDEALKTHGMNGHLTKPIVASEVNAVAERYCAA